MKKKYIKIISVMTILSIIFFLTIGLNLIKNNSYDHIAINKSLIIQRHGKRWRVINKNMNNYNWKLYYTYVDHELFGENYLYFNDNIYLFDKEKKALNYEGSFIAFDNSKYKDISFNINESTDNDILENILKKYDIDLNQNFTSNYYIDIDIDNDNVLEKIYVVSNIFPIDNTKSKKYFGFVYLVDDNKVSIIYSDVLETSDSLSGCKPSIRNIIVEKDTTNYIILECSNYSAINTNLSLYEYKNGRLDKKISTNY